MTAQGPFASFDAFYRSQHERLFHYFRRRIGQEDAPDLVQEAFTRMLRAGAFERVESPEGYLIRTAHNLLINRARTWRRKQCMLYPLDEARDAPVPPDQIRRIEELDIRRIFRPALLAMRPRTRRIFLMSRLRQQTYREIADELAISEKMVEQHMSRALARCRRAIAARWLKQ